MSDRRTPSTRSIGPTSFLTSLAVLLPSLAYADASGATTPLVLTVAALAIAGFNGQRSAIGPLPRFVTVPLIVIAMAYAALAAYAREVDVSVVCDVLVAVTLLKLFERRGARDYAHLLILSVALLIGAMLLEPSFIVSISAILFVPLLAVTSFMLQMAAARERAGVDHTTRDAVGGVIARLFAVAVSVGLPVTLVVFITVPRGIGRDTLFELAGGTTSFEAGMSDSVRLGESGVINDSDRRVLDMQVRDDLGVQQGEQGRHYYLRGAVLERTGPGQWERVNESPRHHDLTESMPTRAWPVSRSVRPLTYSITFAQQRMSGRVRAYTPWQPVEVTLNQRAVLIERRATGVIEFQGTFPQLSYTVRAVRPEAAYAQRARSPDRISAPEYASVFVGDILEQAGIPVAVDHDDSSAIRRAASAIESYFQENFAYSHIQVRPPPGVDALEWFMNERREGHCEYFAAAMVTLCHALGIDARMVTGYIAVEFNETTGVYVVREGNAHAWVEVHIGEGVWVTFDPTPPGDLQRTHDKPPSFLRRVARAIRAAEMFWADNILGFGRGEQQELLGGLNQAQSPTDVGDPREQARSLLQVLEPLLVPAALFCVIAAAGWLGLRLIRSSFAGPEDWARRVMLRADRIAGVTGVQREPWEPPLAYATRVEKKSRLAAECYRAIASKVYAVRFALESDNPSLRRELNAALRLLRDAVREDQARGEKP